MFCHKCGGKFNGDGDLFCTLCGTERPRTELNKDPQSSSSKSSGSRNIKTLDEYMSSKSKERSGFFSKKRKPENQATTHSLKKSADSRVAVNIGIIAENEKGNLSAVRGSRIPLKVCKDFGAQQVLKAAVKKHADHDQFFATDEEYVLLYPDQKIVEKVPGTEEEFSVSAYKRELSKPYSKVDLFLCKTLEYTEHLADDCDQQQPGKEDKPSDSFTEGLDLIRTDMMCTSDTGNCDFVLPSDVAALKEIFPDTKDFTIKRALELSTGSRDKAAASLMNWDERDCREKEKINNSDSDDCVELKVPSLDITRPTVNLLSLDGILSSLFKKVNQEKRIEVRIARRDILWDGLRQIRRRKDLSGLLKISFLGEPEVDTGGLRKEFLSEMMSAIEQRLFEPLGNAQLGRVPVHHVEALEDGSFETIGQLIVLSLAQGGPPPNFLAVWVYRYLCTQDLSGLQLNLQDIADVQIRELINETSCTEDLKDILACDANQDVLFSSGYRSVVHAEKKDAIARAITMQYTVIKVKSELDQSRQGLKLFDVLDHLEKQPSLMESLFVVGNDSYEVTSDFIIEAMTANYDVVGSSRWEKEVTIMEYLNRFLQDLEDKGAGEGDMTENEETENDNITVADVFFFFSGMKKKKHCYPLKKIVLE